MQTITATQFKAKCLAILDEVDEGAEIVITKHGRPVARVVPVRETSLEDLRGSITYLVDDDELMKPFTDEWELTP